MESFFLWLADKLGLKDRLIQLISNINFEQISKVFMFIKKIAGITLICSLICAIGGFILYHYIASKNPQIYCRTEFALENSIYPNKITLKKNAIIKKQLEKWKDETPEIHTIITYFGHRLASDSYELIGNTMWTKTKDGINFPSSRELKILDLSVTKDLYENCISLQEWIRYERTSEQIRKKIVECEEYPVKLLNTCPILMLMSDPLIDLKYKPLVDITRNTIMYTCIVPHSGSKNSIMFYFTESSTNYYDVVRKRTKLIADNYVVN
jgi:hypothetical protein